jgi:hypothetical protein
MPRIIVDDICKHARIAVNARGHAYCSKPQGAREKFGRTRLCVVQYIAATYGAYWRTYVVAWGPKVDPKKTLCKYQLELVS